MKAEVTSPLPSATGIKILEMTGAVAGPFSSRLLTDLGAEVIKIERPPLGDMIRYISPVGFSSQGQFTYGSAGKKSICVEIATPEGREIVRELIRCVDVFLENFTPGAVDRLGFGYEELRKLNPTIIMCSVSGFGQTGPLRDARAVDATIQGWSGMASMIGEPDDTPFIYRSAPCDSGTGTQAALAISAALLHRDLTGRGQRIDVAMLDSAIAYDCFNIPAILASHGQYHPQRAGRLHPSGAAGVARARDRDLVIGMEGEGANSPWGRLAACIGMVHLADDPRFRDQQARIANQYELFEIVDGWLGAFQDSEAALRTLRNGGVVAAPVLNPWEALTSDWALARGAVRDVPRSDGSSVPSLTAPYRFSDLPSEVGPTAFLGEHNEEVLTTFLGYDQAKIERLHTEGVLYTQAPMRRDVQL